jgi:hypothetical protein
LGKYVFIKPIKRAGKVAKERAKSTTSPNFFQFANPKLSTP